MKNGITTIVLLFSLAFLAYAGEPPQKLVEGLGAEDFKEREISQKLLLEWANTEAKTPAPALFKLSQTSLDPEIRQRCLNVLRSLSDQDYFTHGKGFLGITMQSEAIKLPDQENPQPAIRITNVVKDSPADSSGLQVDDVIIALGGKPFKGEVPDEAFRDAIAAMKPLDEVTLQVRKANGDLEAVKVILTRHPGNDFAGFPQNMRMLDQRARQQHFEMWLKEVGKKGG